VASDITRLLARWRAGDESALNEIMAVLYDELHRIASRHTARERSGHTLQTTALLHEAYLKLVGISERGFANRVHFLAVASRVMRQVLIDYARGRATKKRSGYVIASELEGITLQGDSDADRVELLDLHSALCALEREDPLLAQLIGLRYFGGMTAEETAEALGKSVHVVRHDLRLAQAWLRRELRR
jgi:RNA polymerase sigma factor (TIGR02999 family)